MRETAAIDVTMMMHGLYDRPEFLAQNNHSASWARVNPGADVRLWPFSEAEKVLEASHPQLMTVFAASPLVGKAGMLRFALVEKFGGMYLDLDVECVEPFGELARLPLVMQYLPDNPPMIQDTIFGSARASHPFWTAVLTRPGIEKIIPRDAQHASYLWGALPLLQLVQRRGFEYTDAPLIGRYTRHHSRQAWKGREAAT